MQARAWPLARGLDRFARCGVFSCFPVLNNCEEKQEGGSSLLVYFSILFQSFIYTLFSASADKYTDHVLRDNSCVHGNDPLGLWASHGCDSAGAT